MPDNLLSIGKVSKITGITIKALRFYEKLGLIKPHFIDPSSKYRYYSADQLVQLDIIKASRAMGISPKQLKSVMDKGDSRHVLDFLKRQNEDISKKMEELQNIKKRIDSVCFNIQNSIVSTANQDIMFKEIPLRYVIRNKLESSSEKDILSAYFSLYKTIEDHALTNTYETGIIFSPTQSSEFHPSHVYNTIEENNSSYPSTVTTIQEGHYLCICYNKNNASSQMGKILNYIQQNKIEPVVIIQVDLLNNIFDANLSYVELQILPRIP